MDVETDVLEKKVVGINWRSLAVPFVAFASSFQSFWQNKTSESWGDQRSKQDLFPDKHIGILSYSYSECGFANEAFPILVGGWMFFTFPIHAYTNVLLFSCAGLAMTKGYLVSNIMQYYKGIFTWWYETCHKATLICQNWAITMNADPHTIRIFINICLWDDNFNKAIFQNGSDWAKLDWDYMTRK